jgi:hypothetical protein
MPRVAQFGIALGALGMVLALMGLFPGVTGQPPTPGIGIVQIVAILIGLSMLVVGALVYVKFTFYFGKTSNLGQQIGLRLALTGLVFASLAGMADFLGFGSHLRTATSDILLGPLQALGMIGSFVVSSIGVILYAVAGTSGKDDE